MADAHPTTPQFPYCANDSDYVREALRILPVPDVSSPRPSLRILPAVEPSFTERIIARLNERESEERDPWLNDDYRQARLTVTYAGKAARSRSLKLRTRSTALTRNMSGNGSRHCGRLG